MARVGRKVHDKVLLKLIGRYLRAGVMVEGVMQASEWGTPQVSPLTPCTMLQKVLWSSPFLLRGRHYAPIMETDFRVRLYTPLRLKRIDLQILEV